MFSKKVVLYSIIQINKKLNEKVEIYKSTWRSCNFFVPGKENTVCRIIEATIETCAVLNNTATVICSVQYA